MIWLLFGIFVVVAILMFVVASACWDFEEAGAIIGVICIICAVVTLLVALLGIMPEYKKLDYIDTKIEYLTEQNAQIDDEIKLIISSYQDHELEFYKEFENVSSTTLITLYPEIKSNELVNKQLDIYFANQQEIKELELKKIDGGVIRWWMNFGD
jgi:signal transduction histidine kinase